MQFSVSVCPIIVGGHVQVGCTAEGKLVALEVTMYSNGGNSLDLSTSIMDRALLHIDCVYNIPNVRASGNICRTNHASNTAFRGFGGPQVLLLPTPPEHPFCTIHPNFMSLTPSNSFGVISHQACRWYLFHMYSGSPALLVKLERRWGGSCHFHFPEESANVVRILVLCCGS